MNTLGTPYKYGRTTLLNANILSYGSGTYGFQIAYSAGRATPFVRHLQSGVIVNQEDGGGWSQLYGESYKPTAADVGALALTGGTLTGNIYIEKETYPTLRMDQTTEGSSSSVQGWSNAVAVGSSNVAGSTDDRRALLIANSNYSGAEDVKAAVQLNDYIGGVKTAYAVFGEHNKPSGSYTGNGSETARTIDTGGVGDAVIIRSSKGTALVSRMNGLCYNSAGVTVLTSYGAKMAEGVLTLATTNEKLNANGITYYYQVL